MKKLFTLCTCIAAIITAGAQEFTKAGETVGETHLLYNEFMYNKESRMFNQNHDYDTGTDIITIYDFDFNIVKTISIKNYHDMEYQNWDNPHFDTQFISVTQTLFNDDENFEYFANIGEYPSARVAICSEDGTVLYTFPENTNVGDYVITMNGKHYITTYNTNEDYTKRVVSYYLIDKQTTSIKKVAEIKGAQINTANGSVNIALQNQSSGNSEVIITNINGQVVKLVEIPTGVKDIDINTTGMQCGIYNFTITEGNKILESGKIAVK